MRVIFVFSGNSAVGVSPFITEQANSLKKLGVKVDYFPIQGKGWKSYLKHIFLLGKVLKEATFDLIHAHFVWCGFVGALQRKIPLITTFHGCDINIKSLRLVSKYFVIPFSKRSIFVNSRMLKITKTKKGVIIPCGVDLKRFYPIDREKAREKLDWPLDKKIILFSSTFDRIEKNYKLAIRALELMNDQSIEMIKFTGFDREKANLVYSACNLLLLTSIREGSPQVIKEAMACNCPIVSTDVGDVREVIAGTEGCYITSYSPQDVAEKLKWALEFGKRTDGRNNIRHLESSIIAEKLIDLYRDILDN